MLFAHYDQIILSTECDSSFCSHSLCFSMEYSNFIIFLKYHDLTNNKFNLSYHVVTCNSIFYCIGSLQNFLNLDTGIKHGILIYWSLSYLFMDKISLVANNHHFVQFQQIYKVKVFLNREKIIIILRYITIK